MRKREIISGILKERVLLLDGAYGTELMKRAGIGDVPPEVLNIERPDVVESLHRDYIEAGSDVIITNTFGATPAKLSEYGLEDKFEQIVINAVRAAKRAASGKAFVFGDAGPTGKLPFPAGNKFFDFFYDNYRKLFEIMVEEGVDGIILETFSDIAELKAAVLAARAASKDVFLVAHLTFDENGKTLTGTDPLNFVLTFEDLDVDALGINCTLGPEELLPIFQELSKYTDKFLTVEPNAGMPIVKGKETVYPVGPAEFAVHIDSYWEAGANIIGGCCGTTPEHIKRMRRQLGKRGPVERKKRKVFALSSPITVVNFENFVIIGERINPAGRKKLKKAMEDGDLEYVLKDAQKQKDAGAQVLDVNFGIEQLISPEFMEKVIYSIAYNVGTPVSIDVQTPKILEKLVKAYPGRPLINSFRPVEEEMEKLRILKEYGGTVVLLSMEEEVPESYEDRLKAFERGLDVLLTGGIDESRIIVDPIVLAMGAGGNPGDTLKFIEYLSNKGFKTTLGLSNLSFGLPDRSYYNASFLVMAVDRGLSSAIMNPLDEVVMKNLKSALVIAGREELPKGKVKENDEIVETILSGDSKKLLEMTETFLEELKDPLRVVEKYLRPAMEKIGQMYDKGKIFLPQLILAAQTVKPSFEYLESLMKSDSYSNKKVIIATVKGDVHDIGKNIVAAVMKSSGYDVIDLGKDVPAEVIVKQVKKEKPMAVALSAMMTTTAPRIAEVVERLKELGIKVPVLAGGASLNERLAKELGADFYAKDASGGVKVLKELERKVGK
ncbi:MAG: homocysteine S-methyltransferase family protein [Thermotogaceae bacterium]|nr:homocysteine S-methyltransferase family protein [Thermotogaceae bacterium]